MIRDDYPGQAGPIPDSDPGAPTRSGSGTTTLEKIMTIRMRLRKLPLFFFKFVKKFFALQNALEPVPHPTIHREGIV
jgi:hypothetical protein